MKKFTLFTLLFLMSFGITYAQHLKKDGTPDRRYKENKFLAPSNSSTTAPNSNTSELIKNNNGVSKKINSTSSSTIQCSGTTKKGARCKRMTKSKNGLCFQHGGN